MTFLDELVELERQETLLKKNLGYKHPRFCKNCGKLFDSPTRRLSCSEECRLILLSKGHSGKGYRKESQITFAQGKKKDIIDLDEEEKATKHETVKEESLDSILFMDS